MLILLFVIFIFCTPTSTYSTIIDVLSRDPRFTFLLLHLQKTRLVPLVNNLQSGTLFAPDNDAFKAYTGPITRNKLLYHILPTRLLANELYHGQLLESRYVRPNFLGRNETGQQLKITRSRFQDVAMFVNQAQIIDYDIPVNQKTVIQAINSILDPPLILTELYNSEYARLLAKTGVLDLLNDARPFTLFVTQHDVLSMFNSIETRYILSPYGQTDLENLLNYTLLNGVVYSSDFKGVSEYATLSGEDIVIEARTADSITVNGIPIIQTDILAANGVIHIVDGVMIPPNVVFDTRKYLYGMNTTKIASLLDSRGLGRYLDLGGYTFYTILAPANDAIFEDDIPINSQRDWLRYHVLKGMWYPERLEEGMLIQSESTPFQLDGNSIRLPVHIDQRGVPDEKTYDIGTSIRFGQSRVLGDPVAIGRSLIYPVSEPLDLPGNLLTTLVVDLEVSTFITMLFISGVVKEFEAARGITLFVPTNAAFLRLGLTAKYLVHPSAKSQLQSVLRYHAAQSLVYHKDMLQPSLDIMTLNNIFLRVQNTLNNITVGSPDGDCEAGLVDTTNLLVSNGVIHKMDRVLIPHTVEITHDHLLLGIGATAMQALLRRSKVELKKDWILLVPTNRAFARIDFEAVLNDDEERDKLVRMHILPTLWQTKTPGDGEYPTLLSDLDRVVIGNAGNGERTVRVKGWRQGVHAHVLGMGHVQFGRGGVVEVDTILVPIERGYWGLPIEWSNALVATSSVGVSALGILCVWVWRNVCKRRRMGYTEIPEPSE
ncbi:FAS1 domain-containing protein [Phycomyces nitens]|nr:FAS1 domain-containing protein [Phycomyces nitens]